MSATAACHYCGQPIGFLDLPRGYGAHWCTEPVGGPGTGVCPARDDDRHSPVPDEEWL